MSAISFNSLCVHDPEDPRSTRPHQLPIYATSSFDFESIDQGIDIFSGKAQGHVYGRYGNPTIDAVAGKIAQLETHGLDIEASAILCSSGMAAIAVLMTSLLRSGDKILTQGNLYGGTTELFTKTLAQLGIQTVMTDLQNLEQVEALVRADESIRMLYFETPANPTLACVDIEALAAIARRHGRHSAIDNTFCTPYLQQPLALGADFVIHSTTKYLNGHGNSIAGAIVGRDAALMRDKVAKTMKLLGANCNAWDAWLTNLGMKTLTLRMDRHCANALALAQFLQQQPAVAKVNYPGLESHPDHALARRQMRNFGGMLSFELTAGYDAAIACMNQLTFCSLAPTLGDVDTLILHPASSSHLNIPKELRLQNGITDGLVRVSVGIEDLSDLIADFEKGLAAAIAK
ncbi:MAG TPA: aminotransferase class I/II-fold pyridoxal phosphate-dependent enzyme [Saprospiraceae bacterium]|jgi:methionine-gamma-lyase|nr:aminotransferase class I/II-fold pyridoxal phosphate-dependent enzyme [Saprospiraceae bacterium]